MSSASDNVENAGDIPVINKVEQGNNPDDNLDMEDGEADVFSIARDHQPSTIRFTTELGIQPRCYCKVLAERQTLSQGARV